MIPSPEEIVRYVERHPGARTRPMAAELGVADGEFDELVEGCLELQRSGRILRVPHGGWEIPGRTQFRVGKLQIARAGQGFVRVAPGSIAEEDLFVRRGATGSAFSGDLVLVQLAGGSPARRGREGLLRESRVIDVIERARRLIRGRFTWRRGGGSVKPFGGATDLEVLVPREDAHDLEDGEEVLIRLSAGASRGGLPRGKIVVRGADEGTLESDLHAICELYDLPSRHPTPALDEAAALDDMSDGRPWADRIDLRREQIFTIDPADAKDFDDAVSLERLPGGKLRLGVHIADVSHYVRPGSALDREASDRGTSVYLPGRVIPMLPERISNGLASLRPCEDRLTKTVRMVFTAHGILESYEVFRSVIRSVRRFTYEEVLAILERLGGGTTSWPLPPDHVAYGDVLRDMARLRDLLFQKRRERGALNLDIPRLRLELDEAGNVRGLAREARDPSHSLIEEFMLVANEVVARFLIEKGLPVLARVHAPPEEKKLEEFRVLLRALDLSLGAVIDARELQRLVDRVASDPLAGVIQLALLRTMEHAAYVAGPGIHFALATASYCHFTSPIRRYPDLIVHQILDEHFDGGLRKATRKKEWWDRMPGLAERTSDLERRAEEAEREMTKLRLIRYLQPLVGEEMEGTIVSVHPFGFFVRIEGTLVEGMVPVATLEDDYYEFDEARLTLTGRRSKGRFALGDRIRVVLSSVDPDLREITFRVRGAGHPAARRRSGQAERTGGAPRRRPKEKGRKTGGPARPRG